MYYSVFGVLGVKMYYRCHVTQFAAVMRTLRIGQNRVYTPYTTTQ